MSQDQQQMMSKSKKKKLQTNKKVSKLNRSILKLTIAYCIFLFINKIHANKHEYLLFISVDTTNELSFIIRLTKNDSLGFNLEQRKFNFNNEIFYWDYLYFPKGSVDLIGCCELQKITWERVEIIDLIDSIGENESDLISKFYLSKYKKLIKKIKAFKEKKAFILDISNYRVKIFKAKINSCQCQEIYTPLNYSLPLGFESYIEKIYGLTKLKQDEKKLFIENIDILEVLINAAYNLKSQ